ncbi:calmodulin [Paragonimus westermani]|uniref:Calmodulin n=1 Tax=Paragonimus westermani TaxID=34504 RepID=A0A5J4NJN5_9TREM|nr:calmodulin [Paragonimus westermani]
MITFSKLPKSLSREPKFVHAFNYILNPSYISALYFRSSKMAHVKLLQQEFDAIDKNRDRKLSINEVIDFMKAFGFKESQAKNFKVNMVLVQQEFMKAYDNNKDGKISRDEFTDAAHKIKQCHVSEAQLRKLFQKADLNNSGKIGEKELKAFLVSQHNKVSNRDVEKWIREHDVNKDGQLNYEEFLTFLYERM